MPRVKSPRPGISTFVTSAPSAPSSHVQYGPASMCVTSSTRTPAMGPLRPEPTVCSASPVSASSLVTVKLRFTLAEKCLETFLEVPTAKDLRVPWRARSDGGVWCRHSLDHLLGGLDGQRGVRRQGRGQSIDRRPEDLGLDHLVDEPDRPRLGRVDKLTSHQQPLGLRRAD